jgi:hypothetical protein
VISQNWTYNLTSEARRLTQTAHQLATYFYQINGFYVVPSTRIVGPHTILFPDLTWSSVHRIWERASSIRIDSPLPEGDHKLIKEIEKLLCSSEISPTKLDFTDLKNAWTKVHKQVFAWLASTIPHAKAIKSLNIHPTRFGSIASFNCFDESRGIIELYLRQDASLHDLVDAILGSVVHTCDKSLLQLTWQEQEAVCDWLLSHSSLKPILDDAWHAPFKPTLGSLRHAQALQSLRKQSDEYLRQLGLHHEANLFTIQDDAILCKNKPLSITSHKQRQVLTRLIKEKHISQDELADVLFSNEEDYSLYVMAKFVQRLRELLEANGLSGSVIQTVRGQGLVLAG